MGYSFRLAARVLLYASSHRQDTTAFVTPIVEHWLKWQIAKWVYNEAVADSENLFVGGGGGETSITWRKVINNF